MGAPLRILHLEDNINDAELVRLVLKESDIDCTVERVETREAFTELLARGSFNLILCDYTIPSFDGLTALALAREKYADLPFIFVSGTIGEDRAVESFLHGATDYVLKDRMTRLGPAVRRALKDAEERQERRRAEEALVESEMRLRESEQEFRILAEQSLVGTYIIQYEKFIYVNPRLAEMFGCRVEEFVGRKGLADLVVPDDRHIVEQNMRQSMSDKAARSRFEVRGLRRQGDLINIEIFGSSMLYEGTPAVIGIVMDVTEKKKLEDQLRQAQKMEAVGQLTGGIAHDFNNILSAIVGYASLLQMKMAGSDPLRQHVDQILAGADRAANLIRSLLTFSRKQITSLIPTDVNEVISRVDRLLGGIIGEDIDNKTVLLPGGLVVSADAGQLEQVLMNLATNARDAMPQGGVLSIETSVVDAAGELSGRCALVSVTDTGVGMDEKTRERIFEPFFTTKDLGRGTGLGLSMVYGIIKHHGGSIHCYSEPGKGTTFKMYLPLLASGEEGAALKTAQKAAEGPRGGTETILVVEDDEALRKLAIVTLGNFGYRVIAAVDGEEAVEKFRQNKDAVKLVLCDVIMPKKSGEEVREELRRISPEVRIIFMSGYPADIIKQKGLLAGSDEILLKPVAPSALLKKIREALDQKDRGGSGAR